MTTSDRFAHLPKHNVTGPGVGPQLSRPMHSLELAEQLADRLDREHGTGTHRVNGQLAPAARASAASSRTSWSQFTVELEERLADEAERESTTLITLARRRRATCDSEAVCNALDQIIALHVSRISARAFDRAAMMAADGQEG